MPASIRAAVWTSLLCPDLVYPLNIDGKGGGEMGGEEEEKEKKEKEEEIEKKENGERSKLVEEKSASHGRGKDKGRREERERRRGRMRAERDAYQSLIRKHFSPLFPSEEEAEFRDAFTFALSPSPSSSSSSSSSSSRLLHQIYIDVLRTKCSPFESVMGERETKKSMVRMAYIWAMENEEMEYFQGEIYTYISFFHVLTHFHRHH